MMVLHGGVVAAGNSQSAVSRMFCGVGLWKRMPRLPPHPPCVSAGLFVFLAFEEHQCLTQRVTFFLVTEREHISLSSALMLECLILELCTQASKRRACFDPLGPGRRLEPQTLSRADVIHAVQYVTQPCCQHGGDCLCPKWRPQWETFPSLLCLRASFRALHHLCCTSNESLLGLNKGY